VKTSWVWMSLCLAACGGGDAPHDEDDGVEEAYGVIDPPDEPVPAIERGEPLPEAWSRFCVASFTRDFTFESASGDPLLTIQRGDELLLYDLYASEFGVLIPVPGGVQTFNEPFFHEALPFDTNCDRDQLTNHIAVFANMTLYEDPELTRPICQLERGTTFPFDSWGSAQTFADELVKLDIAGWSEPCAGHDVAYFAQTDDVWPIQYILGPGE
jgi:hypothetical protein